MAIDVGKLGTATFDIGADPIADPLFVGDSFDREYAYAEGFQNDDPDQPIDPADFTGFTPTIVIDGTPFAATASFPTPANGKLRIQIAAGVSVLGEFCYEVTVVSGSTTRLLQRGAMILTAKLVP